MVTLQDRIKARESHRGGYVLVSQHKNGDVVVLLDVARELTDGRGDAAHERRWREVWVGSDCLD